MNNRFLESTMDFTKFVLVWVNKLSNENLISQLRLTLKQVFA